MFEGGVFARPVRAGLAIGGLLLAGCAGEVAAANFFSYSGTPLHEPPQVIASNATSAVQDRLRVASYNIENFTDAVDDAPERTPEHFQRQAAGAARLVEEIDPAVLVIQEIENATSLLALNRALKTAYPVALITKLGTEKGDDLKLNLAVLSRVALQDAEEIDFGPLTGPGRPTRGLLRFSVDLGGGHRLLVYVLHLKSNFGSRPRNVAQRSAALKLMCDDAKAVTKAQPEVKWEVLALGDTNVDSEAPQFADDTSFRPLKGWVDAWRGRPLEERTTIPTRHGLPELEFPPATFDRFFLSPALTNAPWTAGPAAVLQKGCVTSDVTTKPGVGNHVSDHFPVYIDLTR